MEEKESTPEERGDRFRVGALKDGAVVMVSFKDE
jgi:hypothetical protein